jgi:sec-independent protein translocase protein TatA
MPNIGPTEIILLLLLALLLFGARRLPEIGRSLGQGMREFKDSVSGNSPARSERETTELPVGTQDTTAPAPPRERENEPVG